MRPLLSLIVILSFCRLGAIGGVAGWLQNRRTKASFRTPARKSCLYFSCRRRGGSLSSFATDTLPSLEVIGAGGRMGSLFLQCPGAVAVPRGVSAGFRGDCSGMIIVATPSACWHEIYEQTPQPRKSDLVWVGNGIPFETFRNTTVVVPHFGVLSVGAKPTTTENAPPTFIYGKHADQMQTILDQHGLTTQIVSSWEDILKLSARKLLWASCMWLLCHANDPPLTLSEVHSQQSTEPILEQLVEELLPALASITGIDSKDLSGLLSETLEYFRLYSLSMSDAIPSKHLAMNELQERNGIWLAYVDRIHPQNLHQELIREIAGKQALDRAMELTGPTKGKESVHVAELNITLFGDASSDNVCQSVIVIGGGIVGSSIAMNLARRDAKVTVLDRLPNTDLGATTPASWAWINANSKKPLSYQLLNQLGMQAWRNDDIFAEFPSWNGALVQFKSAPDFFGGYSIEGPLAAKRILELEPQANFSIDNGPVYFFRDEGCVDPSHIVKALRHKARQSGVVFVGGANVTSLQRDDSGRVVGVTYVQNDEKTAETLIADVVVVAAGVGSSLDALGGLPLAHSPGQIAYAKSSSKAASLSRIVVDTARQSHVLMRRDGTIVAGGGYLQVGGLASSYSVTESSTRSLSTASADEGSVLLERAKSLAPAALGAAVYTHFAQAPRPMPKDGWPAVGYLEDGLYVAVTHSGVTLAPIIGATVAAELSRGISLDLLRPYRPNRLF